MDNRKRACIAIIIASYANKQLYSSVFDNTTHRYLFFSLNIIRDSVSVYDYSRHCYISGRFQCLYDYGSSSYLQINSSSRSCFTVYDYQCGQYATVTIVGRHVTIFDYEFHRNYYYDV